MKYLLDTNVLSDVVRGVAGVRPRFFRESSALVSVSAISELEIEYGIARNPNMAPAVVKAMRDFFDSVTVLPFEREDARAAARLRATLEAQGQPIGPYDVLIAATALRRGLMVVTANTSEFSRVGGLALENWRE